MGERDFFEKGKNQRAEKRFLFGSLIETNLILEAVHHTNIKPLEE
jgi:hypothetical protein